MPRKTMSLMEEQEAIKRILPDDPVFNPEFVYFVLANLHKFSTYCQNCHIIYGNKQHLGRHHKDKHPNAPKSVGKDVAKFLETLRNIAPPIFLPNTNITDRADRSTLDLASCPSMPMPVALVENVSLPPALKNGFSDILDNQNPVPLNGDAGTALASGHVGEVNTSSPVVTRSGNSHFEPSLLHHTNFHSPPLPFNLNHSAGSLEPAVGPQGVPNRSWPPQVPSGYNMGYGAHQQHFGGYVDSAMMHGGFGGHGGARLDGMSTGNLVSFGSAAHMHGNFLGDNLAMHDAASQGMAQYPYFYGMNSGYSYGSRFQHQGGTWNEAGALPSTWENGGGPPQASCWNTRG